jgi:hypothetical protein
MLVRRVHKNVKALYTDQADRSSTWKPVAGSPAGARCSRAQRLRAGRMPYRPGPSPAVVDGEHDPVESAGLGDLSGERDSDDGGFVVEHAAAPRAEHQCSVPVRRRNVQDTPSTGGEHILAPSRSRLAGSAGSRPDSVPRRSGKIPTYGSSSPGRVPGVRAGRRRGVRHLGRTGPARAAEPQT